MADPVSSSSAHDALRRPSEPDRNAKIEHLLLSGLDHYFAAEYEQAINVWTRALFLDRGHARARAYIERARAALAERQRESEELVRHSAAAFERGDGEQARALLQKAMSGGVHSDEAFALLNRLNRLQAGAAPAAVTEPAVDGPSAVAPSSAVAERAAGRRPWSTAIGLLSVGVLVAGAFLAIRIGDWRALLNPAAARGSASVAPDPIKTAMPMPRRGEVSLARARALEAGGHLRDALAALDGVRSTDPERAEADRFRADIQRKLLALELPLPRAAGSGDARP
jgi:hypothetical protein